MLDNYSVEVPFNSLEILQILKDRTEDNRKTAVAAMQWHVITLNISQVKLDSSQALFGAIQEVMSSNDVADNHVAKVCIDRRLADDTSLSSAA